MERKLSRRSPNVLPQPARRTQRVVDDRKIHDRYMFGRGFRLRLSQWSRSKNAKIFATRKAVLYACCAIGIATTFLKSADMPTPTRGFLKTSRVTSWKGRRLEPIDVHPRSMGYYFAGVETETFIGAQRLDPNMQRRLSHNIVKLSKRAIKAQQGLLDSDDYYYGQADPFEEGDCVAQYEWQKKSFPTCNTMHELPLTNLHAQHRRHVPVRLLSNGYWRDVWRVRDFRRRDMIIKTLRYTHDYEERNYDRHRRDAVAMEHLSTSSHVIDIYGFCGNSVVSEFADGGDLDAWSYDDQPNTTALLLAAYQVASGVADMHNIDKEGTASIAHSDIASTQFVLVGDRYKLNDFNRARYLRWNNKTNEPCPFKVGNNPGTNRSPEEYRYDNQTEKIDIYSMGNVFYSITTGLWPFQGEKEKAAQKKVMKGERPKMPEKILDSKEPEVKAVLNAMQMCWVHDPKKRATSRQVQTFLREELLKLRLSPPDLQAPVKRRHL